MWCVQRRACPHPLHLNLSPRPDSANQLRLTSGFITEYQQQTQAGLQGDALFAAMFRFSVQGRTDFQHQSAGLAVLSYLFERCEVFEQ